MQLFKSIVFLSTDHAYGLAAQKISIKKGGRNYIPSSQLKIIDVRQDYIPLRPLCGGCCRNLSVKPKQQEKKIIQNLKFKNIKMDLEFQDFSIYLFILFFVFKVRKKTTIKILNAGQLQ